MIAGVRLTQIANGEPILSTSWRFEQDMSLVESAEARLNYLFNEAKKIGFTYIIDTIKLDYINGQWEKKMGTNNYTWTFNRRMEQYRLNQRRSGIKILFEIDFKDKINKHNWEECADYIIHQLINKYFWVDNWQIGVEPDKIINDDNIDNVIYNCDPIIYCKLIKYINDYIKNNIIKDRPNIKIGGPGIFDSLVDFYKKENEEIFHNNFNKWLYSATGAYTSFMDDNYKILGEGGIFNYLNFFSFHGKQNTDGLNYNKFIDIIDTFNEYMHDSSYKKLPLYSTLQGQKGESDSELESQGYYELRNILNGIKKGVVPFVKQLIDEVYNENLYDQNSDTSNLFYGLMKWHLSMDKYKPAYYQYLFLFTKLNGYNTPLSKIQSPQVLQQQDNQYVDSVSLMNNSGTKIATVLWLKQYNTQQKIVLSAHHVRKYLPVDSNNLNSNPEHLDTDKEVILGDEYDFIIVFEENIKSKTEFQLMENDIRKKINYTQETLLDLISLLPNTYNKEVTDVNYYKLLRSLSLELSDAKLEIDKLEDNRYLNTAHKESIYNNFGVLINLKKRSEWDHNKYRNLVKGTMKSLLHGPTKQSIINAIELFTSFNVNIHELNQAENYINKDLYKNVKSDFVFVVEIEKPIDEYGVEEYIHDDANYVLNIVKPAHTLSIVIVSLTGEENYQKYYLNRYGKNFSNGDKLKEITPENKFKEGVFGWSWDKTDNNYNQLKLSPKDNEINNNSYLNSNSLLGPRYRLNDKLLQRTENINFFDLANNWRKEVTYFQYNVSTLNNMPLIGYRPIIEFNGDRINNNGDIINDNQIYDEIKILNKNDWFDDSNEKKKYLSFERNNSPDEADYCEIEFDQPINESITIDVEFRVNQIDEHNSIISQQGYKVNTDESFHCRGIMIQHKKLVFWSRTQSGEWKEITAPLENNDWTKARLTQEKNIISGYVNGNLVGTLDMGSYIQDYYSKFRIGKDWAEESLTFSGDINKVAIWSINKKHNEVYINLNGDENGLEGYYKMDGHVSNSSQLFSSTYKNHGDIEGAEYEEGY